MSRYKAHWYSLTAWQKHFLLGFSRKIETNGIWWAKKKEKSLRNLEVREKKKHFKNAKNIIKIEKAKSHGDYVIGIQSIL